MTRVDTVSGSKDKGLGPLYDLRDLFLQKNVPPSGCRGARMKPICRFVSSTLRLSMRAPSLIGKEFQ
jgi:hypothetical protein